MRSDYSEEEERLDKLYKWENIFFDPLKARLQGASFEGQMAIIRRQRLLERLKGNGLIETKKNEEKD